jgi:beta-xylosidase
VVLVTDSNAVKRILTVVLCVTVVLGCFSINPQTAKAADSAFTAGMDMVVGFDFNGNLTSLVSGVAATAHGTDAYAAGQNGNAANLSSNFYITVANEDGSSPLAGLEEFVVSYDSNPSANNNSGWTFFASRTVRAPKYPWEHYLGIIDTTTNVEAQRFHNNGGRPVSGSAAATAGWRHVDVHYTRTTTRLYIDGTLVDVTASEYPVEEVLSAAGGFIYIGHGLWGGPNGNEAQNEYFTGALDNFRIWKPAALGDADAVAAAKADLSLPYGVSEYEVRGNIELPAAGKHGTAITWAASHPAIVTTVAAGGKAPGIVARPASDTVVTMTATITKGAASAVKTFQFLVKAAVTPKQHSDYGAYLFAHFTGGEGSPTDEQIYFATSLNGTAWTDLRSSGDPILTSDIGELGVRDPYILRSPEGDKFYLIATDLSINRRGGWGNAGWSTGSTYMIIWESPDLVNWSDPRRIDVAGGIHDAGMLWAPEAVYDEGAGDYFVFWATQQTISGNASYLTDVWCSRTRDFWTFTEPSIWIDNPNNETIDTTVIKSGDYWYRSSKVGANGVTANDHAIDIQRASSLEGTWTTINTLANALNVPGYDNTQFEGPELFLYNQNEWVGGAETYGLMVDNYAGGYGGGYIPFRATNLGSTNTAGWSRGSDIDFGALTKRHGSIMPITTAEYDAFMAEYQEEPDVSNGGGALSDLDMTLLSKFDFNDLTGNPGTGTVITNTEGSVSAKATVVGGELMLSNTSRPDNSGYSLQITENGRYLNVTKNDADSSPFLAGLTNIVISYDSRPDASNNTGWTFYAAQNTTAQDTLGDKYIGALDKRTGLRVERFNGVGRDGNFMESTWTALTTWKHVDIHFSPTGSYMYIDGVLTNQHTSALALTSILTATGGIFQIGKANWGGGEYYRGYIDNFAVYKVNTPELLLNVKADAPRVTITTTIDQKKHTAKLYINRPISAANGVVMTDLSSVPLDFTLGAGVTIIGGEAAAYDLRQPVTVQVTNGTKTQTWTLSAELDNNAALTVAPSDIDTGVVPSITYQFADPDVKIFGDKYYIYPTTDGYPLWSGYKFHCFSSDNLIDWVDEGVILDLQASAAYNNIKGVAVGIVPWSNGNAWAPAIEYKNGLYYFYFCGHYTSANEKAIGVAWSTSPTGPFTVKDSPLVANARDCGSITMGQTIDPSVFTDPDTGVSYLLFGNGNAAIVELNDDMISFKSGTMRNYTGATDFREAIMVVKADGMYHFTWSCEDTGSENYSVAYGVSASLFGPISYKGRILSKDMSVDIAGPAHHSMFYHPERGEWYIVYARHVTPLGVWEGAGGGQGNHREVCIDYLPYADGVFKKATPTHRGVLMPTYVHENVTIFDKDALVGGQTLTATTYVTNREDAPLTTKAILAVYNGYGRLIQIDTSAAATIGKDQRSVSETSVTLPADAAGLTVKAYVWDGAYTPYRMETTFGQ